MSSSAITELVARLKAGLARRAALAWMTVIGAALALTSLDTGLVADDWIHAAALRAHADMAGWSLSPVDLFRFADGDPAHTRALQDSGDFPWTASLHVKLAFLRPLSALTHLFDHAAWPDAPWLMHLQNVAWLAVAILGAGVAYRRLFGATWIAGLAALLF